MFEKKDQNQKNEGQNIFKLMEKLWQYAEVSLAMESGKLCI